MDVFFTEEKKQKYDVISSGSERVWGFLCLIRNSDNAKSLFKQVSDWKEIFEDPKHYAFDEKQFSSLFIRHKNFPKWLRKIVNKFYKNTRRASLDDAWSNPGWSHGWLDGGR